MSITRISRQLFGTAISCALALGPVGCAGPSQSTSPGNIATLAGPARGHTEHDFLDAIASVGAATAGSSQVIVALGDDNAPADQSRFIAIAVYESAGPGQPFGRVLGPFPGAVGFKGFAQLGQKREGDRTSPTGCFSITELFGEDPQFKPKLPYKLLAADDVWCEDPSSPHYNTWIKVPPQQPKPGEAAQVAPDELFWHGAVIDYNRTPVVPGAGSGIFMHKAEPDGAGTYGCVGLAPANLDTVLLRLDPARRPMIVMGTPKQLRRLSGK